MKYSTTNLNYSIRLSSVGIPPTQYIYHSIHLYCPRRTVVAPGERILIDTGVKFKFPAGKCGVVVNKPSDDKQFVADAAIFTNSCPGYFAIDVRNTSDQELEIRRREVLAQMIVIPKKILNGKNEMEFLRKILNSEQFSELKKYFKWK